MATDQETYNRAKEAFEKLELRDKVEFLAEATAVGGAEGFEQTLDLGREVANKVVDSVKEAGQKLEEILRSMQTTENDDESEASEGEKEQKEEDDEQ